ncbi:MAG: hypothetical protein RBT69_05550 [Spirochaetia bacterium]|jgi:hypothetical protein|nr:hypothetical protein [Spirochaetia bacterium]
MKKLFLFLICCIIPFTSLAAQSGKKALLAMESTKFKKVLIEEMKNELESRSVKVTIVSDHKKELSNYKASDFDYVFITNSGVNSKVRPWVKEWLNANNNSKNILLHTTKIKEWEEKVSVDAISSASLKKDITPLAKEYTDLLLMK